MKLAIMQPYFFPYIGYFQLINAVDLFILYDNIKYTKKGWINRNRILQNGRDALFSLPLQNASDSQTIVERRLSSNFSRAKLLNQIIGAYRRAPYFEATIPLIRHIVQRDETNLFDYLHHSLLRTCEHLGITTTILVSSKINIDHTLRSQEKVLALCAAVGASHYINSIGGTSLYSKDVFSEHGVDLQFIQSHPFEYPQFGNPFVPSLSIIDVLMFNPLDTIQNCIKIKHELI